MFIFKSKLKKVKDKLLFFQTEFSIPINMSNFSECIEYRIVISVTHFQIAQQNCKFNFQLINCRLNFEKVNIAI